MGQSYKEYIYTYHEGYVVDMLGLRVEKLQLLPWLLLLLMQMPPQILT